MNIIKSFFAASPTIRFFTSIIIKFISAIFILLIFVSINSCSDSGVEIKLPKNPFEMAWISDTITYPKSDQVMMETIWASSSKDVWIAGHNDRSIGEIFHFDGTSWKEIDPMNDVPRSPKTINKVMGLNANNIWMVGDRRGYNRKDLIINYDGKKWYEHNMNAQVRPISLFANRKDDIWVGCDSAVIYHYDGIKWEREKITMRVPHESSFFINGIIVNNNITLLNVAVYNSIFAKEIYYTVKGTMKNWTVIDSMEIKNPMSVIKWGNWGLSLGKEGGVYSFGYYGVWQYIDNNWVHTLQTNYAVENVFSYNTNYQIAVGHYGTVWFFDGSEWKRLEKFFQPDGGFNFTDAWTDGRELFLVGYTTGTWPSKTVVWRGK
ncbi:MAG: hypothetical protein KGZ42_04770 [Melioribacter sp.]|nr:hypothetical protein [Melioribacter sp.]